MSVPQCRGSAGNKVDSLIVCFTAQSSEVEGCAGPDHVKGSCDVFCIILCMSVFSHVPVIECRTLKLKVGQCFFLVCVCFFTAQSLLVEQCYVSVLCLW